MGSAPLPRGHWEQSPGQPWIPPSPGPLTSSVTVGGAGPGSPRVVPVLSELGVWSDGFRTFLTTSLSRDDPLWTT